MMSAHVMAALIVQVFRDSDVEHYLRIFYNIFASYLFVYRKDLQLMNALLRNVFFVHSWP